MRAIRILILEMIKEECSGLVGEGQTVDLIDTVDELGPSFAKRAALGS